MEVVARLKVNASFLKWKYMYVGGPKNNNNQFHFKSE